jgi:cytochrome c oxidase subunit II
MRHALAAASLALATAALVLPAAAAHAAEPRTIAIVKRFAFTPSEVTLKKGEPVTLQLRSEDVTHGLFVRPLGIDAVASPGKPFEITLTPTTPGRYVAICDHFCGSGHGGMKMVFVVE